MPADSGTYCNARAQFERRMLSQIDLTAALSVCGPLNCPVVTVRMAVRVRHCRPYDLSKALKGSFRDRLDGRAAILFGPVQSGLFPALTAEENAAFIATNWNERRHGYGGIRRLINDYDTTT
jgi:hypothetical protein